MSRQHSPNPMNYQLHGVASSSSAGPNNNGNGNGAAKAQQQRAKGLAPGITASAEDVKYQTKYKELKRKVKEIELDNDKLYLKLLLAKKNIRRMNLERAILYERLAAVPPTPGRQPQELPDHDPAFPAQNQINSQDMTDHAMAEYMHAHPNARVVRGPDGRVVAIEDTPPVDARGGTLVSPLAGPPPPHGIPVVHNFQHESGPGFDPQRQLPALPPMAGMSPHEAYPPPLHGQEPPQHRGNSGNSRAGGGHRERERDWDRDRGWDGERDREHGPPLGWQHGQEPLRSHSNASSHPRERSRHRHNRGHSHGGGNGEMDQSMHGDHGRLDTLPPVHRSRRSSVSESEGGRGRRHDLHELTPHQAQQHGLQQGHGAHPHIQVTPTSGPPSPPPGHSPTSGRPSSGRLHNHQRVGPGAQIYRERDPEHDRELYHAREIERMEEVERARDLRERMAMEDAELRAGGPPPWVREEQGQGMGGGPGILPHGRSRSDTPVSNDASRPTSGQSYERDSRRVGGGGGAYAGGASSSSRNHLGLESGGGEYGRDRERDAYDRDREDRHAPPPQLDSRKRSRNDMEVDADRDARYEQHQHQQPQQGGSSASKRMHRDDRERDEGPMDQDD